jgi:hypothetical protein
MWFNVFFALLVAGVVMPFVWQLVKVRIAKLVGNFAFLASICIDMLLAAVVLLIYGQLTLPAWIASTIIVFVTSRTVFDHVIKRFFPRTTV